MSAAFVITKTWRKVRSKHIRSYTQHLIVMQHLFEYNYMLQQRRSYCISERIKRFLTGRMEPFRCSSCILPSIMTKCHTHLKQSTRPNCYFSSSSDGGTGSPTYGESTSHSEKRRNKDQIEYHNRTSIHGSFNNRDAEITLSDEPLNDNRNNSTHGQSNNPSFKVSRVSYKTGSM